MFSIPPCRKKSSLFSTSIRDISVFSKLSILHNNEKPYAEGEILIENAVFHMLTESIEDSLTHL